MQEVRRISEEPGDQSTALAAPSRPNALESQLESPWVKTPEDKLASYPFPDVPPSPEKSSATVNGPINEPVYTEPGTAASELAKIEAPVRSASRRVAAQRTPPPSQYIAEGSPQLGKELTLFLQYKSKIKKFVLPDGGDLSLARLQLAFIEKFAWNTQNNGVDLPEIYIQDPVSGVRHELEDLTDIKERSVLALNVEALDEVKRHIDDGLGGLRRIVEGIRTSVEDQSVSLQRVSDRQQDTAKEIASMAATPLQTTAPSMSAASSSRSLPSKDKAAQLTELTNLRKDLAVVRQTYTSFVADMNASMTTLRSRASSVKTAAADSTLLNTNSNTSRSYLDRGKKQLSTSSEKIVNRVDDLQDMVEDLRKDVVTRGVRPLPRQLEDVSRDISTATSDLKKLQEFLKKEKPVWTKIWERELQVVCDDRDLLTLQEELAVDLEDDLEKAAATFALVEEATKQQNLHKPDANREVSGGHAGQMKMRAPRSTSRNLRPVPVDTGGADPHKAKDTLLGEVRALQPNHENRLEAIERAERARQRELELRKGGEFERELGSFVEEGRLKKTGGVEEVERLRRVREEAAKREVAERQAARMRERNEREAAAAEAAANAAANHVGGESGGGGAEGVVERGLEAEAETGTEALANGAPPEVKVNGFDSHDDTHGNTEKGRDSSPEPGFEDATEEPLTPTPVTPIEV